MNDTAKSIFALIGTTYPDGKKPKRAKIMYISGPITGKPNGNKEAFYEVEAVIIQFGNVALNPHRIGAHLPEGSSWLQYMRVCIIAMMGADGLLMLPGWLFSKGARIEWLLAKLLGIPVEYIK